MCGPVTDAVMPCIARGGRIAVCGTVAIHDWDTAPLGPRVHRSLLVNRAQMSGFVVFDYQSRYPEALAVLKDWVRAGKLRSREHVLEGAESARGAIAMLYDGTNRGRLLVRVDDELGG